MGEGLMNGWVKAFTWMVFVLITPVSFVYGVEPDLNTKLMLTTFKIAGRDSIGTAFIMGKPIPGENQKGYGVLVTAAHVLKGIKEDEATVFLRKKEGEGFVKRLWRLAIRKKSVPLWKEHPIADVAVMFVKLPTDTGISVLSTNLLVTDEELEKYEIHPGDTLFCLGYPLGAEANEAGFPILRNGPIASYPLIPTSKTKTLMYDLKILKGNSGGPVYFYQRNRSYGSMENLLEVELFNTIEFIAGLVSQEASIPETIRSLNETRVVNHPLSLAIVVHASYIKEAIDLLPEKPD